MIIQHKPAEGGPLGPSGTSQDIQIDKINVYETHYGMF